MYNHIAKPLFLFLCFINTAFAFDGIAFELQIVGNAEISPLQGIVVEVGMTNQSEDSDNSAFI